MAKKNGKKWKKSEKPTDKKLDGRSDDIIIPIMGATGAGKSTFINEYIGKTVARTSPEYNSCTPNVEAYLHTLSSKRRIVLVDTPGFNDSHEDETEILRRVAVWLAASYEKNMKVAGVIYLNDISQKRMYGSTRMNLTMFQELCGPKFFHKVVMVSTHWDTVSRSVGESRETELKQNFWVDILENGATTERVMSNPKSSDVKAIVNKIVSRNMASSSSSHDEALALQKELVELDKSIPMTGAGKELKYTLKELAEIQKQAASDETDPRKKEELRKKMVIVQQQIKELNIPFSDRLKSFLGL
ncbi:hypothetical protein FA15DRAFT_61719 [Coprinopsis marcescibilis]|uniref:AIG1-type G domain-containing protein n=1 Tax=Coprinopsis marcescibilis TaxID=230819 RepID=A0A5C3L6Z4_COPMA|nr:hypothetical protein FA15DRAFT_61719 [Coprinopsis marcescibilis]